ncbi:hypothetical protein D9602_11810 [Sphingomonas sp. TX0522]|jgi:hypothetical protein|nr:hypothetical protein [Sphingomonas sp. TX0522]
MQLKRMPIPKSEAEWRHTASAIIRANLKLARMNHVDLVEALRGLGVEESQKTVSAKLGRGSFSATFMLQCSVACGTEQIELPIGPGPAGRS